MLDFLEKQRRTDINLRSLIHARGWATLFNTGYFRDKESEPIQPTAFVPFPDEFELGRRSISHETEKILRKLIQEKKLSPKAIALAVKENPQLKDSLKQ